jgi:predicted enzyme related to lactoylglutathione lyase
MIAARPPPALGLTISERRRSMASNRTLATTVRLNHVTLGATDVERSADFYRRLGLRQIVAAYPDYARFVAPEGDATLSLQRVDAVSAPTTTVHFESDALDETVRELEGRGSCSISSRPTSPTCGARRPCAIPTATSSSSTARAGTG